MHIRPCSEFQTPCAPIVLYRGTYRGYKSYHISICHQLCSICLHEVQAYHRDLGFCLRASRIKRINLVHAIICHPLILPEWEVYRGISPFASLQANDQISGLRVSTEGTVVFKLLFVLYFRQSQLNLTQLYVLVLHFHKVQTMWQAWKHRDTVSMFFFYVLFRVHPKSQPAVAAIPA